VAEPVLLDTCAALWLVGGEFMSDSSVAAMRAAYEANVGVYISPFTAWEIGTLAAKGRMQFAVEPSRRAPGGIDAEDSSCIHDPSWKAAF
jgi:PIN domain nuclease of toxin-antitoxin system